MCKQGVKILFVFLLAGIGACRPTLYPDSQKKGRSATESKKDGAKISALDDFIAAKKPEGWVVEDQPEKPHSIQATVVRPGLLSDFKPGQQVTLKFYWEVISIVVVDQDKTQEVHFKYASAQEPLESEFMGSTPITGNVVFDLFRRKADTQRAGTESKLRVKTEKFQKKMIVSLQQVVRAYDRDNRLKGNAYLARYGTAALLKKEGKQNGTP